MKIGGKELTYDLFVSIMTCIIGGLLLARQPFKVSKSLFAWVLLFFLLFFASIFYELFFPYENLIMDNNTTGPGWDGYLIGHTIKTHVTVRVAPLISYMINIIACTIAVYVLKTKLSNEELLYIIKKINRYLWLVLFLCVIEFVIKNILNSAIYSDVIGFFLGTDNNTFSGLMERGDLYQLQGVSREPAHLAFALYWCIIFQGVEYHILERKKIDGRYILKLMLSVFLLVVSGSFSSYVYIAILLLLYLLNIKNRIAKYFIIVASLSILSFGVIWLVSNVDTSLYLGQRIEFVFVGLEAISNEQFFGYGTNSVLARFVSIYDVGKDFLQRPILGLGPMIQVSHSGLINILSDMGVLGFLVWCKCLLSIHKYHIIVLVIILIFPNVIMGVLTVNTAFALYTPLVIESLRKNK